MYNWRKDTPVNMLCSHFSKISSILWSPDKRTELFTSSMDSSFCHWKHFGDKWDGEYTDVIHSIDESLDNVADGLSIPVTAISINSKYTLITVACGTGQLRSYNIALSRPIDVTDIL